MSHLTNAADTAERRAGARIPLGGVVRMGPPSGEPYASVSARNLSRGGIFIDADRPVKIGARFSTEIELPNGDTIYIAEAEVAYNREHDSGSGFGVRFVDPPAELVEAIESEIKQQLDRTHGPRAASIDTALPAELATSGVPAESATQILYRDTVPPRIGLDLDLGPEPS